MAAERYRSGQLDGFAAGLRRLSEKSGLSGQIGRMKARASGCYFEIRARRQQYPSLGVSGSERNLENRRARFFLRLGRDARTSAVRARRQGRDVCRGVRFPVGSG